MHSLSMHTHKLKISHIYQHAKTRAIFFGSSCRNNGQRELGHPDGVVCDKRTAFFCSHRVSLQIAPCRVHELGLRVPMVCPEFIAWSIFSEPTAFHAGFFAQSGGRPRWATSRMGRAMSQSESSRAHPNTSSTPPQRLF